MKRTTLGSFLVLPLLGLSAMACNPAVDPAATFTAEGKVVSATGQPLAGAEVRLIKYSSDLNVFAPTIENLFADSPSSEPDIGLSVSVVQRATTDMDGRYTMTFTGQDIAAEGGYTTEAGLVEVATTLVVVRDPSDSEKRAGTFSYPYVYQQAAKNWDAGTLDMWNADAKADTGRAATAGVIDMSWKKLPRLRATDVRNAYRVTIGTPATGYLIFRCNENDDGEFGCRTDQSDSNRIVRSVSAYSVYSWYSDGRGSFSAYVQGNSADYRYVAKFTLTAPIPDVTQTRDGVQIRGAWAVGTGADQDLLGTPAIDGRPSTRQAINNSATSIYVSLVPSEITDAGILNTLVRDASKGCVQLEFSVDGFADIGLAKASTEDKWTRKGKFCGEQGGVGEMSALFNLDTTASNGVTAAWMRLRALPDTAGANVQFQSVGEVAIYKKRM